MITVLIRGIAAATLICSTVTSVLHAGIIARAPIPTVPGAPLEFPTRQFQVDLSVWKNGELQPGEAGEPSIRHTVDAEVFYEAVMSPNDEVESLRTTIFDYADGSNRPENRDYGRVELSTQLRGGSNRAFGVEWTFSAAGLRRRDRTPVAIPEWDEPVTVSAVERLSEELGPETWLLRNVSGPWENNPETLSFETGERGNNTIFEGVVDGDLYRVTVDRYGWLTSDVVLGVPEPGTIVVLFVIVTVVGGARVLFRLRIT